MVFPKTRELIAVPSIPVLNCLTVVIYGLAWQWIWLHIPSLVRNDNDESRTMHLIRIRRIIHRIRSTTKHDDLQRLVIKYQLTTTKSRDDQRSITYFKPDRDQNSGNYHLTTRLGRHCSLIKSSYRTSWFGPMKIREVWLSDSTTNKCPPC